jgi:hypothetical protein
MLLLTVNFILYHLDFSSMWTKNLEDEQTAKTPMENIHPPFKRKDKSCLMLTTASLKGLIVFALPWLKS